MLDEAAALRLCRGEARFTLRLFCVELLISVVNQALDAFAITSIDGNSNACGQGRQFFVLRHNRVNALSDAVGFFLLSFGKNEGKFVAAVTGGEVNRAAIHTESVRNAADSPTADQMAVGIVDFLEAIKVEQEKGERCAQFRFPARRAGGGSSRGR